MVFSPSFSNETAMTQFWRREIPRMFSFNVVAIVAAKTSQNILSAQWGSWPDSHSGAHASRVLSTASRRRFCKRHFIAFGEVKNGGTKFAV